MRAVVQRVSRAKVTIENKTVGEISEGLVVLLGISTDDSQATIKWMCNKLVNLRVFPDQNDKMNLSVLDIKGEILVISNFTVYGDAKKGFRPNFMAAAAPEISEPLYNSFINYLKDNYQINIASGIFGAMMDVELVNAGPVTIIIEK